MTELPIRPTPLQTFQIALNGVDVEFTIRYEGILDVWTFDLKRDDVYKLRGRRIVLGVDLFKGFALGLGSLVAVALSDPHRDPARGDLGDRVILVYQEPAEAAS